jgi:3-methyladenine DNA glycosylase/8-oxoguanine DNA glycosylase
MGSTLNIQAPNDFNLARDVCSYGYFLLAPNHWDVDHQHMLRVLELDDGPTLCKIDQPSNQSTVRVRARFDRTLSRAEQSTAKQRITRMLCLNTTHDEINSFHKVDPRWKKHGAGRLFRSPTLFEDVIKTVTSCNVTWPSTVNMNRRLCEVCGRKSQSGVPSFPTAKKLARTRVGTLRGRCRVGYRDQRIIDLAKIFSKGQIDEHWLENTATDDEVFKYLITLPGIGPYAAGNIMQLMGRYSRLALDTESIRHAKAVLNMTGTDNQLMKELKAHYEPFGDHKFRSYWFELWEFYQSKAGPATTWRRDATATMFTAANLSK